MDKNSIIGWVLIALLMFGFFGYQSRQIRKQQEWQAQQDSIARVEAFRQDSIRAAYLAEHPEDTVVAALPTQAAVYSDSLLNAAANAEAQTVTLQNEKLEIVFTTMGAQPLSVRVKDYQTYDKSDLYILTEGKSQLGFVVYAPTAVDTRKFNFQYVPGASTDSIVVMRLPFSNGGYIEETYTLVKDSYSVNQVLSFVNMENLIPRNVGSIDVDFEAVIPRMEKGYKNESQYSRLNYYFPDDKKPENIGNGRKGSKRFDNKIEWFAFQQQFFSAIMRAPKDFTYGEFSIDFMGKDHPSQDLMACSAQMRADIQPGAPRIDIPFEFYFGPNNYKGLKAYDHAYEKVIPLGGRIVGLITKWVIIPLFDWLSKFIKSFGLIILLMTIFIKLVVLPFAYKSLSSSAKMQVLRPELDKINAKYPKQEDAMKKQQATMDLYKKAGWGTSVFGMDHISLFALLMALSMFFYSRVTMQNQNALLRPQLLLPPLQPHHDAGDLDHQEVVRPSGRDPREAQGGRRQAGAQVQVAAAPGRGPEDAARNAETAGQEKW